MKFVILAGGSGVRLWPISRDLYPKSLLNLYDGSSLIQNVYKLALDFTEQKNIVTVTNIRQLDDTKCQLYKLSDSPQIVAEPMAKNTASAVASALYFLLKDTKKFDEIVTILPVDFSVKSPKIFKETIDKAKYVAKQNYIVALGVKPLYPESGFGYIKVKKNTKSPNKKSSSLKDFYIVEKFIEKPDKTTLNNFLTFKNIYWNTGIYVSKISVLLEELQKYAPKTLDGLSSNMFDEQNKIDYSYYEKIPEISIDYAVMEKTDKLAFIELKTLWKDYGSWSEVYNNSEKTSDNNVQEGNVIAYNVSNSLLYSSKEVVCANSIDDTIVVDTEDALLVCDKDSVSNLNILVNEIKKHYAETTKIQKTVIRPWGIYTCLNKGNGWLSKIITVFPEHKLSLQSHNYRSEHWVVLEGCATVLIDNKIITLEKGTSIDIPIKSKHSLQNNTKKPLKILEVQKGEYIGEDDIVRYEDIYGRSLS